LDFCLFIVAICTAVACGIPLKVINPVFQPNSIFFNFTKHLVPPFLSSTYPIAIIDFLHQILSLDFMKISVIMKRINYEAEINQSG
jgi:hypothetical protein